MIPVKALTFALVSTGVQAIVALCFLAYCTTPAGSEGGGGRVCDGLDHGGYLIVLAAPPIGLLTVAFLMVRYDRTSLLDTAFAIVVAGGIGLPMVAAAGIASL